VKWSPNYSMNGC